MYNQIAIDLNVKGTNLCSFLQNEKKEMLISVKLFDNITILSQSCYAMDNPSLAKTEVATLRKNATIAHSNILLHLETLYVSGFISAAQKDSMVKTLDILKKQMNI